MSDIASLYTDGGVVGRNPSTIGGTWAWVQVADDGLTRLRSYIGVVTPSDIGLPEVTNNLTEFLAALYGLESMPRGWAGTVYTDSGVTKARITDGRKFNGIPDHFVSRLHAIRQQLGAYRVVLLGGHPTALELHRGFRRDGKPCSVHNVYCDQRCGEEAARFRAKLQTKVGVV